MSELRHDPTTDRWVIVAPERSHRPRDNRRRPEQNERLPSFDPTCPFCPGNESMLPSIIKEIGSHDGPCWRTRVVANKFPVFSQDSACRGDNRFYERLSSRGYHEVIVEAQRHDQDLPTMSIDEICDVFRAYKDTYKRLMAEKSVQSVILFRNRGTIAGASLRHPHSQVAALATVPPLIEARQRAMLTYYQTKGHCIICDVISHEQASGSRVISENDAFLTIVPFAPVAPCETWLLPKRHEADFGEIENAEIRPLAFALQGVLLRLEAALGGPSYNYVIDTASKGMSGSEGLHWCVRIVPQTTFPGGFELGSGLPISPSLPEQDAAVLRSIRLSSKEAKT